jgi:hypothetical protein
MAGAWKKHFIPQKHEGRLRWRMDIKIVLRISGMQGYDYHLCDVG